MRIYFFNMGCKVNFAEISVLKETFIELGHSVAETPEEADAAIINSCTVTSRADADCRKIVRRILRANPNAAIAVIGCQAQTESDDILNIEGVDYILGNEEKFRISEIMTTPQKRTSTLVLINEIDNARFHSATSIDNEVHTRTAVKIQDGCNYFCTYCAVAYSRGRSRSIDFEDLRNEILKLNSENAKEIVLSGINIGDYKSKDGKNFYDVVQMLDSLPVQLRYRISSIEPNLLTDEIITSIAKPESLFCPHFHIPLQSGCNRILRRMNRRYTTEFYAERIAQIHSAIDLCCIGIDVICGFPGETDEDFDATYRFLTELDFAYLHVFTYSDRPIAAASKYPDKVSPAVKKERTNTLRELSEKKRRQFYSRFCGKQARIIPEIFNPETQETSAWTDNYVPVRFKTETKLPKEFRKVKILSLDESGFCTAELL